MLKKKKMFTVVLSVILVLSIVLGSIGCASSAKMASRPEAVRNTEEAMYTGRLQTLTAATSEAHTSTVSEELASAQDKVVSREDIASMKGTGEAVSAVTEQEAEDTGNEQETVSETSSTSDENSNTTSSGNTTTVQNPSHSVIQDQTQSQIENKNQSQLPSQVQEQAPAQNPGQGNGSQGSGTSTNDTSSNDTASNETSSNDTSSEESTAFTGLSSYQQNLLISRIVADVNALRGSGLSSDSTLISYAATRAAEASYCWSHTRPNGTRGCDMIDSSKWRGENLAKVTISSGFTGSDDQIYALADRIVNNWVNSSSHYANLVSTNFTNIGVYTYVSVSGESVTFYTAAMFSN